MEPTRRQLLHWAGAAALSTLLPLRSSAMDVRVLSGPAFGSAWRLVLPDTREAATARARLEAVVARVDARMSPYRSDSEMARFGVSGSSVLSAETEEVVRVALALARDSAGAFDPTTAPFGRRFGFGPASLSPARPAGRYRDVRLSGGTVATECSGLSLDLCGVAKGYALDAISRTLDGLDFLLELGGEIVSRGRHPSGRPWRVGIETPGSDALWRIRDADARALATSGDGAQGYTVGGRRYAHVIDPRRGEPVRNGVASVSVLAASGMLADGLSTAAMVLGPRRARPLLVAHDASALFLMRRARGLAEVDVNGFLQGGNA